MHLLKVSQMQDSRRIIPEGWTKRKQDGQRQSGIVKDGKECFVVVLLSVGWVFPIGKSLTNLGGKWRSSHVTRSGFLS